MLGSCLARAALILGIAVSALVLAVTAGVLVAHLVLPSHDDRSAGKRPSVASVETPTYDDAPTPLATRAVITRPSKPEEHAREDLHTSRASNTVSATVSASVP